MEDAAAAASLPELGKREDLRATPLVTIDGEDAKDFEPVRKLRWKERPTDEDQHRYINRVQNVQEVLNQPHQRYQATPRFRHHISDKFRHLSE